MPAKWVDIGVDGQNMEAYVAEPTASGRYPAVIVAQEIWGVNHYIQAVANRLPPQGYVAVAPAMFHREGHMVLALHDEWDEALARLGRYRDTNILDDIRATIDFLKAQPNVDPNRIGIVGFCAGGRISYLAACNFPDIKASVAYYSGAILQPLGDGKAPVEQTANLRCPVLGLFGEEDQNPSPDDVEKVRAELEKHNKAFEFHMYPGCGHGFDRFDYNSYRPEAARDAWGKTMAWFDQHLKG